MGTRPQEIAIYIYAKIDKVVEIVKFAILFWQLKDLKVAQLYTVGYNQPVLTCRRLISIFQVYLV